MRPLRLALIACCALALGAAPTHAQGLPTPQQARQMLQDNPALLSQLRDRIAASGMSPDQVRSRLRAAGYPEELLDQVLGSGRGVTSSVSTSEVFAAVRDLGLTDETDLRELRRLAGLDGSGMDDAAARRVDTLSLRDSTITAESAEIFGLSLFRGSTSQFMPNVDGPVDENYRLGPGDRLALILTGEVEQSHTLDVSRSGRIVIPDVGELSVANLTLAELEDLLYTRLGRVYSGVRRGAGATSHFSVTVTELRSNQVFVTGDVRRPGSYRVTSAGTALTALYAAGGPTERGSLRRIEIRRGGTLVSTLDVYDYLVRGDASSDVRLRQGDVVHVPIHGARVRVDGAVARPATYESKPGEGLGAIIDAAGGLRADADGRRLVVERVLPIAERAEGRVRAVFDVPLAAGGEVPEFAAADGDLVRVPRIADRVRDRISVAGHVWTPGPQGLTPGLTLTDALRRAGGLQPDAYLGTVHVSRLRPDSTRMQLRAMLVDSTGATLEPLVLQGDDEITVYSRTAFRPPQHVVIGGAVRKGGRFAWREGMTVRDLVLLAGGLTESAYLREAEVARLPGVRAATGDARATAVTLRVPLDSSYLFANGTAASATGDTPLEPCDNVLIMQDPLWRAPRTVWVTGEVRFPGPYTLTDREERLSDVLERAGGLTDQADPRAAHFTRLTDSILPRPVAPMDSATAARDSLLRAVRGTMDTLPPMRARTRIGVELDRARRGRGDDLMLEDGDSLHVPRVSQVVEVRGAVHRPTALAHDRGASLGRYVNGAGGPNERARTRRMYVIQPNGLVETRRHFLWLFPMDPEPLPGSIVVVPERTSESSDTRAIQVFGVVAQVLAALTTLVIVSR